MIRIWRLRLAALATLMLLTSSCSRSAGNSQTINRDAAARCVKKIDAWRQELMKLDALQKDFDAIDDQIRVGYKNATPEDKVKLRNQLTEITSRTDAAQKAADRLFRGIMWELGSVSSDRKISFSLALAKASLRDLEGVHTPEVQQAMDALYVQLQILLQPRETAPLPQAKVMP